MRMLTVSSLNFHRGANRDESMAKAMEHLGMALPHKPDLVVLPECFANTVETPEAIEGPIIGRMSGVARENRCHVVAPLFLETGGLLYNSSVLLDPDGDVRAIYNKNFPTDYEIAAGVTPGTTTEAIDAGFGRIGLSICFDLNFHEAMDGYGRSGVDMILWSSAYEGGRQLQRCAMEHSAFVVSATWVGTGFIINRTGHVLESGDAYRHPVMTRRMNLDSMVFHLDYNFTALAEMAGKYGPAIQIQADVPEGRMTIESLSDDVTIEGIKGEYDLETFREYLDRSRRIREQALTDRSRIGGHMRAGTP